MFEDLEKVLGRLETGIKEVSSKLDRIEKKIAYIGSEKMTNSHKEEDEIELMSRKDVAKTLRVHIDTVSKYINENKLESIKMGRRVLIERHSLKKFIKNNRIEGDGSEM